MTDFPLSWTKLSSLFLVLVFASGCGGEERSAPEPDRDAAAEESAADTVAQAARQREDPSYRAASVDDAAVVRGTVRYAGERPDPDSVAVPEDERSACGRKVVSEPIEVGDDGGLKNAVVSVKDIARGRPFPDSTAVLDQSGCRFDPRVVVLPVDGELTVENSDPVTHNVHTVTFENRPVNRSQPTGVDLSLSFAVPERLRIECDIHSWMGASVVVSPHPYHSVTDSEGRFSLEGVPAGSYTIEVWHPELGTADQEVTVEAGTGSTVSLTLSQ